MTKYKLSPAAELDSVSDDLERDEPRLDTFFGTKSVRMLIVEDQDSDAALACELVQESMPDFDWEIRTAASMAEAIVSLSSFHFDLALVDLGLCDAQGAQTIDLLCLVAPHVPYIVYSGNENDAVLKESMQRGAFLCLQKDKTTPDVLRVAIKNALSRDVSKD